VTLLVSVDDHDMKKWMAEINLIKAPPPTQKEKRMVCKIVPLQMAAWFGCAFMPAL
jgi:hypothetical protein